MALAKIYVDVELTEINCGECGGTYAINERYREQQAEKGGTWNCPYCKVGWGYSGRGENAQLKLAIEAERRNKIAALNRANQAAAERDKLARKLKRVGRGVCPECNRTFSDLARHMVCKHTKLAV